MRKDYFVYLIGLFFLSIFFILLTPVFERMAVNNKIITIDRQNELVYAQNEYGTFVFNSKEWTNERKINTIYNDTITYQNLYSSASDDRTVKKLNEKVKLKGLTLILATNNALVCILGFTITLIFGGILVKGV